MELLTSVEIIRLETGRDGTFGVMKIQKQVFGITLEPPDMFNEPNISAIPASQYLCTVQPVTKWGRSYNITDVAKRTNIVFHPGNWVVDTKGCILLGSSVAKLKGNRAVTNSGATFREFIDLMEGVERFHLTIREAY